MNATLERLVAEHPPTEPVQVLIDEVDWQPDRPRWYVRLYSPCMRESGGYWSAQCSKSALHAVHDVFGYHALTCRCYHTRELEQRYGFDRADEAAS